MSYKVLIVEDEANIRAFIKINLKKNNYTALEAESGEQAIEIVNVEKPDIIILDVMLPGIDGFETCTKIREKFEDVGIIMLTAKGQDMDKIMGLQYGADDYMIKPFNPMELLLRISGLIRRIRSNKEKDKEGNLVTVGEFIIDTSSKKVLKNDEDLLLTRKEYLLLELLMKNAKKALSRDELLDKVWGEDYFGDSKIIDVNIRRLRAKIEENSSSPQYIETIWGLGYRWNGESYE